MNTQELISALKGQMHGSYGTARCPAHDDRTPSLSVRDGDDGKLLVRCHAGCDQGAVVDALKGRGLWPGKMCDFARNVAPARKSQSKKRDDDIARQQAALAIWQAAEPAPGTLVETYLRSRGITIPPPASLRFAPALTHGPTGLPFPCLVAGVQDVNGKITGIHRTFLMLDGSGKARVSSPKMMLGKCAGGAVRLALAKDTIAVAEGIEDALSVQQETGIPAWAALSTSGLKALVPPENIINVTICTDSDEPGEKAAQEAAQRWLGEGRTVRIARPPGGHKDFNAALMADAKQDVSA